jgi:hypothetical protein
MIPIAAPGGGSIPPESVCNRIKLDTATFHLVETAGFEPCN